jgi:hypothetical protein
VEGPTKAAGRERDMNQAQDSAIDPKLKAFLLAVRAGLLAICKAIERFIGIEEKTRK